MIEMSKGRFCPKKKPLVEVLLKRKTKTGFSRGTKSQKKFDSFLECIGNRCGMSQKSSERFYYAFCDELLHRLQEEACVDLIGLGTIYLAFITRSQEPYAIFNPTKTIIKTGISGDNLKMEFRSTRKLERYFKAMSERIIKHVAENFGLDPEEIKCSKTTVIDIPVENNKSNQVW